MYSMFFVFPKFAQLPTSTGFGFGASVVVSGLYLLPSTLGVFAVSAAAGAVARRWGSRTAVIVGSAVTASSYLLIAAQHGSPIDMLASAALLGIGIGLSFAALGNLVVEAVPPEQTGAAGGMNTVMRTIGGALGGQLAATLIAAHVGADGQPLESGFTAAFVMAAGFLVVCTFAALLVPRRGRIAAPQIALAEES
jgi:MFS family permease